MKQLQLGNYTTIDAPAPKAYNFWKGKKPFKVRDMGNNEYGNCTIASQVLLGERMERIEQRRTILITREEIIRVYMAMGERLYGGGDNGAYETDALSNWRNPDLTFKDTKGRPYTIDAYVRINQSNPESIKNAIVLSAAHGIKVCFNLPWAWAIQQSLDWDIPEGQMPIGDYLPGSWGGHSMTAVAYDENWVYIPHTWGIPMGRISWRAFLTYCDEAYMVIDSINSWKKRLQAEPANASINLDAISSDVNQVSSQKIITK